MQWNVLAARSTKIESEALLFLKRSRISAMGAGGFGVALIRWIRSAKSFESVFPHAVFCTVPNMTASGDAVDL